MKNEILPLGSVVLLKKASKYLVVLGYLIEDKGKIWDYMGCVYPNGTISSDEALLFNNDQIEKVLFRGFSDDVGEKFRKKVLEQKNKKN